MTTVKVAIIDDTPDLRMLVRLALEGDTDIEVVAEGENGQDGIRIAEQLRPDVMLLDLAMPIMDGMTALPQIRARSPRTQVLVLSGFAADAMTKKALAAGAKQYIQKGASPEVLRRTVLAAAEFGAEPQAEAQPVVEQVARRPRTDPSSSGAEVRLDGVAVTAADRAPFGLVVATRDHDIHGGWRIVYRNAAANDLVGGHGEVSSKALTRWHPDLAELVERARTQQVGEAPAQVQGFLRGVSGKLATSVVRTAEHEIVVGLSPGVETDEVEGLRRAIATAAHEIRNPVTVLSGVAQAFANPEMTDAQRDSLLSAVRRQSKVLERLTDDLLTAARAQRGALEVDLVPTQVAQSVYEAVGDVFPDGHGVHLSGDLQLWAMADPTRLAQMLANLLSNAKKYGEPPVRIDVRGETRQEGRVLLITVSDSGPGVPEEFRKAMFEEYTRVGNERARGTGLGLYVVRSLAHAHGGEVEYSPGVNGGSDFTLRLHQPD